MLHWLETNPWLFAIVTGVIACAVWAVLAKSTAWAGRITRAVWNGLRATTRWLAGVRLTTESRIERRVASAVESAMSVGTPTSYWEWRRDTRPGVWRLENHRGETCTVIDMQFDFSSGWLWKKFPNFPVRVRDGESMELHGSITASPTSFPGPSNPTSTVVWADAHGDQESSWVPFAEGVRF